MLNKSGQTHQKMNTVLFHLYGDVEQAKLIYGDRNQTLAISERCELPRGAPEDYLELRVCPIS